MEFRRGELVRFHNKRDAAEQWITEGKQAATMTRLSCHSFRSNKMRLGSGVIAYNPGCGSGWRCRNESRTGR